MYRYLWLVPASMISSVLLAQNGTLSAGWLDAAPRPSRTIPIYVAPLVYDELALLADTSTTETVRCLMGADEGDTLVIDVAWKPRILESETARVRFERCPNATLAVWHNHVVPEADRRANACALSPADLHEALRRGAPRLMVVQVSSETLCWWSRDQILKMAMDSGVPALPGQSIGVLEKSGSGRTSNKEQ